MLLAKQQNRGLMMIAEKLASRLYYAIGTDEFPSIDWNKIEKRGW